MTDIFISFKNTCKGKKTYDSFAAKEIYEGLKSLGFNVFMMNETLRQQGSDDYMLYIDKALDEATCMIVVSSNIDFTNDSWVRHEWGTFLNEILGKRKNGHIFLYAVNGGSLNCFPIGLRKFEMFCEGEEQSLYQFILSVFKKSVHFDPLPETAKQNANSKQEHPVSNYDRLLQEPIPNTEINYEANGQKINIIYTDKPNYVSIGDQNDLNDVQKNIVEDLIEYTDTHSVYPFEVYLNTETHHFIQLKIAMTSFSEARKIFRGINKVIEQYISKRYGIQLDFATNIYINIG